MKSLLHSLRPILLKTFIIAILPLILLTACATSGSPEAQQSQLQTGQQDFVSHNYEGAFEQLEPLAKSGNANAQYAIGYMYFYGKGVKEDPEMGEVWIKKAARQGQPLARKALALLRQHQRREEASKIFMPKDKVTMDLQKVARQHTPLIKRSRS